MTTLTEPSSPGSSSGGRRSVLEVRGLQVEFYTEHGWVRVVDGVSFDLSAGETLGLVGESGSGKSVTSMAVMGLIPSPPGRVVGGTAMLGGVDLVNMPSRQLEDLRGNDISMIFQEPMTSLNPGYTIGDQIAEVVRRHRGVTRKQARQRAVEVLELVGIPNPRSRLKAYPYEFSGGMRQRVMIAMAVACDPKVLIADEPTTALDVTIQAQILEVMKTMQAELGTAVLFITHDLGVVAELCDRVAVMYAGQVVEQTDVHTLFAAPQHPYTEGLLRSMPQVGTTGQRLSSIPGKPPEPWMQLPGCRFAPRCDYAQSQCTDGPVELRPGGTEPRHVARCVRAEELDLEGAS